jgi:hypothetical protein
MIQLYCSECGFNLKLLGHSDKCSQSANRTTGPETPDYSFGQNSRAAREYAEATGTPPNLTLKVTVSCANCGVIQVHSADANGAITIPRCSCYEKEEKPKRKLYASLVQHFGANWVLEFTENESKTLHFRGNMAPNVIRCPGLDQEVDE